MEKRYTLGNLKLMHFLDRKGSCVDQNTVSVLYGFGISNEKYDNVRRCYETISGGIARPVPPESSVELKTFCKRFKKRSKPYRKIFLTRYRMKFRGISSGTQKILKQ
jgi:hypothetical protein